MGALHGSVHMIQGQVKELERFSRKKSSGLFCKTTQCILIFIRNAKIPHEPEINQSRLLYLRLYIST